MPIRLDWLKTCFSKIPIKKFQIPIVLEFGISELEFDRLLTPQHQ